MLTTMDTKAIALVIMAVVTLVMSFLPLYLRKVLSHRLAQTFAQVMLTGCLCFGAGVLLSIVFLHLLPETRSSLEYAMEHDLFPDSHYPVAEVVTVGGFFLVYLMEEIVHTWIHRAHHSQHHCNGDAEAAPADAKASADSVKRERLPSEGAVPASAWTQESVGGHGSVRGVAVLMAVDGRVNEAFDGDGCMGGQVDREAARHNVHTVPHNRTPVIDKNVSVIGAVVVVVALSFHSVMEGLALGLEERSQDVWILLAALTSHKIFIAFSMSMELLEVGVSMKPFVASMVVFSLASPIGGLIGALVVAYSGDEQTAESLLVPTFLQAVSGGTILYVAFCEVLERERAKPKGGMVRFLALLLGFCLMAGLEAIGGHEHGHKSQPPTAP
ncbi:zinc transporter ZIP1-like [Penaeus japonicus]|uniref:zinc transporter ZIP1-like n=1 Tax=Penaeus japonicus TaxID=27405 RepID=UPI001C716395|nr:zinc transporter ZIP1-like [Penaeus japonicus]XP_042883431.1 zinc transporter ZIP1-like [Penaeus japonicus]XP_042883432.1 zinc transporter ZIP1-like [Penaeus japonicus]XP_042883433.1 zinc transporter ZIP1-like [Penaeus japonicus]